MVAKIINLMLSYVIKNNNFMGGFSILSREKLLFLYSY